MKKQFFMIVAATGMLAATALTSCKKEEVKGSTVKNSKNTNLRQDPSKDGDPLGGDTCGYMETNTVAQFASMTPLDGSGDLYWFRDNVLNPNYTGYYYYLSFYAWDNNLINTQNITQWYQLFTYAIQICDVVQNGQSTDTVITNEIYQFCKNQTLITPNSPNYNNVSSIFQILNSDLENLNGLTKNQFINYID